MRKYLVFAIALIIVAGAGIAVSQNVRRLRAVLIGYHEVPVVSTRGTGDFRAEINHFDTEISYQMSYADLEGNITQSHIHLGQPDVNGGVSVWLCSNLASPPTPAGVQPCPPPPATIRGSIRPEHVVGPASQGIAPGEFEELLQAIRSGNTYVNIHSSLFPAGEIRDQIGPGAGEQQPHHQQ